MKPLTLIRLLLAVRQMNAGQFWALMRNLGASDVMPPRAMDAGEIEAMIKRMKK